MDYAVRGGVPSVHFRLAGTQADALFSKTIYMIFTAFRRLPATTPLALAAAIAACYAAPALADSSAATPAITVSGDRFASAELPIGATVITADDIRRAGATDVNSAIRKIGGVYGRQSLDGTPDFTLDLRGFGSNSSQNLVVLIDGVRLSENELANATLSTIPIDTVDHIEITRGGSSVLYGDGATGASSTSSPSGRTGSPAAAPSTPNWASWATAKRAPRPRRPGTAWRSTPPSTPSTPTTTATTTSSNSTASAAACSGSRHRAAKASASMPRARTSAWPVR